MGKKRNKTLSADVNNDLATKSKRINRDGYFSLGFMANVAGGKKDFSVSPSC